MTREELAVKALELAVAHNRPGEPDAVVEHAEEYFRWLLGSFQMSSGSAAP